MPRNCGRVFVAFSLTKLLHLLAALALVAEHFEQTGQHYQYRPGLAYRVHAHPAHILGDESEAEQNDQERHKLVVRTVAISTNIFIVFHMYFNKILDRPF